MTDNGANDEKTELAQKLVAFTMASCLLESLLQGMKAMYNSDDKSLRDMLDRIGILMDDPMRAAILFRLITASMESAAKVSFDIIWDSDLFQQSLKDKQAEPVKQDAPEPTPQDRGENEDEPLELYGIDKVIYRVHEDTLSQMSIGLRDLDSPPTVVLTLNKDEVVAFKEHLETCLAHMAEVN